MNEAGYVDDLKAMPWSKHVTFHFSDQGSRADLEKILSGYQPDWHVYTCGPDRYMDGVMETAERLGFPEEARHLEYFAVPEQPDYVNHAFDISLAKSGKTFQIPEDKTITDVLEEHGVHVDVKCADGICGVCKCGIVDGAVEHRDFVLSKKQQETEIVLCQSRAAHGVKKLTIDL
jgi:ferredoxin